MIETFSLDEFDRICGDVRRAGFEHIELWMAHAFPKYMTPFWADELKAVWQRHGLNVIGYDGTLSIEHEAAEHDPTDDCAAGLNRVKRFFEQV